MDDEAGVQFPLVDHPPESGGRALAEGTCSATTSVNPKLTYVYRYYRELAAKSRRVKVISVGKTDEVASA
jgi:hypothetical protein